MHEYITPDFDVTVYEIEDVITVSMVTGGDNLDNNGNTWWGWE